MGQESAVSFDPLSIRSRELWQAGSKDPRGGNTNVSTAFLRNKNDSTMTSGAWLLVHIVHEKRHGA